MSTSKNSAAFTEALTVHIEEALKEAVREVADPLIEEMLNEVHRKVRERLGELACGLFQEYDIRCMENRILIEVRNTYGLNK